MPEFRFKVGWNSLGIAAAAGVCVVLVLVVLAVGALISSLGKPSNKKSGDVKIGAVQPAKKADFDYVVPAPNEAWTLKSGSVIADDAKGLVKYSVHLNYAQVDVTVSQQAFPDSLAPWGSDKFNTFINGQNPVRSQAVGSGSVYYLPALQNGSPADGSDTIIYATKDVLVFGRSSRVVGYDAWAQLLAAMKPRQ